MPVAQSEAWLARTETAVTVDAALVVFHTAVLSYLAPESRDDFIEKVTALQCAWISNEAPDVLGFTPDELPPPPGGGSARFLLCLDGRPRAWTGPHGQSLDWINS